MQPREKILAVAVLSLLVLWQGAPMAYNTVMGPIDELRGQKDRLESQVDLKVERHLALVRAEKRLREAKARSLPPNDIRGQGLYQQWLTDLVTECGFADAKVEPKTRSPRAGTYSAVQVTVSGNATLGQLSSFLYRFYRTDLEHHITRLDMESPANEGDPKLRVDITTEALVVYGAMERTSLFPQTTLAEALPADAREFTVATTLGFPLKGPFRVRIGEELLTVTQVQDDRWTVERGVDLTQPAEHKSDAVVELARLSDVAPPPAENDYESLLAMNPFVLPPPPFKPSIERIGAKEFVRSEPLKVQVKALNFPPSAGKPVYALDGESFEGLSINPESGELVWKPTAEQPSGEYEIKVAATIGQDRPARVTESFKVTLKDPNRAPVVAAIPEQKARLGEEFVLKINATDPDGPAQKLTYSLGSGAPEGVSVDAATGELRWVPPLSIPPGKTEIPVQVADDGSPSMTAAAKVVVDVGDDLAQFTFLTGYVAIDDRPQAWLRDRLNNKRLVLEVGSELDYAGIRGKVEKIERTSITLLINNETWALSQGENLTKLRRVDQDG